MHLDGYPPIIPGLLAALLLSLGLSRRAAGRLSIGRLHAWLLLLSLGVILAVTLTPSGEALRYGIRGAAGCDLSRIGPAPWSVYLRRGDPALNILLFMPLGVAIGLMPPSPARRWLIVGAVLLPVAIETTQAVVVVLDRACQGGDVFDNLVGLSAGLLIGWVARALWRGSVQT